MIAHLNGKTATFMPKPLYNDNGNGMHVHQSIWKKGKNLFYKKGEYANLSKMALDYLSGIFKHSDSIACQYKSYYLNLTKTSLLRKEFIITRGFWKASQGNFLTINFQGSKIRKGGLALVRLIPNYWEALGGGKGLTKGNFENPGFPKNQVPFQIPLFYWFFLGFNWIGLGIWIGNLKGLVGY